MRSFEKILGAQEDKKLRVGSLVSGELKFKYIL
jgi:hypothetical protein